VLLDLCPIKMLALVLVLATAATDTFRRHRQIEKEICLLLVVQLVHIQMNYSSFLIGIAIN